MQSSLRIFGWWACIVYATIPSFWLLIHPRVEYWRSRRRSPYLVLLPVWMMMWVVLAAVSWRWKNVTLYDTPLTWVPALEFLAAGIGLYIGSARHFSVAQLGGLPELFPRHREQRLVTAGLRKRVRHPVYLGHLCEMLAWSIGTGLVACYALTVFAIITGAFMIRVEEEELVKRFGDAYHEYQQRVPAILPRLGSSAHTEGVSGRAGDRVPSE
ncbi:MAG TPA: isoprenylcysteine carboxylmethyltransferase family protein [Terriglobales bacterium]